MSRAEIAQTLILLLTGGTEPTASAISGATFNLLTHREALDKLTDEVRATFTSVDEINNVKTAQMPYLNAVISESLRLYPPVPARFPRRTGKGGDTIDGHVVPADVSKSFSPRIPIPCFLIFPTNILQQVSVGVHQWATYHSDRNFHRSEEYIPERWLEDAPAEFRNDALDSVQPFSTGPRNCIGKP